MHHHRIATRPRVAAVALALGAGLALTGVAQGPAQSSPTAFAGALTTDYRNLVQGVVVDQTGTPVDDVEVVAINAKGNVKASDLTYADPDNENPHGYFALHVPRGDYTLTFSKKGYKTVTEDAGYVAGQERLALGEITVAKKLVATTTTAKLKDASITAADKGKVVVTVEADDATRELGDVEVRHGKKVVGTGTLKKADKGELTVTLDKLGKGTYELKAFYLGSPYLKDSESKKVELTVKRKN